MKTTKYEILYGIKKLTTSALMWKKQIQLYYIRYFIVLLMFDHYILKSFNYNYASFTVSF